MQGTCTSALWDVLTDVTDTDTTPNFGWSFWSRPGFNTPRPRRKSIYDLSTFEVPIGSIIAAGVQARFARSLQLRGTALALGPDRSNGAESAMPIQGYHQQNSAACCDRKGGGHPSTARATRATSTWRAMSLLTQTTQPRLIKYLKSDESDKREAGHVPV